MNWVSAAVTPPFRSTAPRSNTSKYSFNLDRSRPPSASLSSTWSWSPSASPNSLYHGLQVYLWVELDLGLQVHLQTRSITASKCISQLHNLGLQMHLHTCLITASKCISKLALSWPPSASLSSTWSWPPSASPNSLDHGLQVHLSVTRSWTPNASPNSLHLNLQVHLQTRSIMASKCISVFNLILTSKCIFKLARSQPPSASLGYTISASKCISKLARSRPPCASLSSTWSQPPSASLSYWISASNPARSRPPSASQSSTRSRPPSASRNSLDCGLQVHLPVHTITASKFISKSSQSASPGAPAITLQYRLQPDWPYVYIKRLR